MPDLSGRTVVVTGGNSGIGFHTADALAAHGAKVVLACRDLIRAQAAVVRIQRRRRSEVSAMPLDLSSMAALQQFAQSWTGPLDLLVNNAGVMAPPDPAKTADGFELQFGTNHLGHFVLTGLLLPALLESDAPRVVTVASIAHQAGTEDVLDGNAGPYEPRRAYANSKLANLLFAIELDRQARARGLPITSVAAHPGVAATGLFTDAEGMGANRVVRVVAPAVLRAFTQSPRAGARAVLYAATEAGPGSYVGPQRFGETRGRLGAARRSRWADDEKLALRLWHVSEELTGFHYSWPAPPPEGAGGVK
jgi:NAD(P)-dependent dehydrogenase (short-subunit alcohol dehydrogenase family)